MKKKSKIIIIIGTVLLFVIGIIIGGYFIFKDMIVELGGDVSLDTENYSTAIEINSNAQFILLFNKNEKISNIIYLNDDSVKSLYKNKIEGKTIEEAMKIIVDNLKNNGTLNDDKNIILIDYGNKDILSKVSVELNKELVIYGVNKQITNESTTLNDKITSLNLKINTNEIKNLKTLYSYSLDIINKYQKSTKSDESKIDDENIEDYALNIYNKLITYSTGITNQTKEDLNGIDITTINATGDYQNELYATSNSWYYIKDSKVYAYINFNYKDSNYDYCFQGTNTYTTTTCPQ